MWRGEGVGVGVCGGWKGDKVNEVERGRKREGW